MNAILILLALLSLATLFSRQNWGAIVSQFLGFPLLILLGFVLSPDMLAVFLPSTVESLTPALRVGLTWLSFLIGLRVMRTTYQGAWKRNTAFAISYGTFSATACVLAAWGLLHLLKSFKVEFAEGLYVEESFAAVALVLGGAVGASGFASARKANLSDPNISRLRRLQVLNAFDALLGFAILCVVIAVWPAPDALFFDQPWLNLVVPMVLGLVLSLTEKLSADFSRPAGTAARLAMFGLATLGTGLAVGAGVPEAPVGFFFGLFLSLANRGVPILDRFLLASERPVRMIVFLLAGVFLEISWAPLIMGAGLAGVRLLVKRLLLVLWPSEGARTIPFAAVAGFSDLGLPLILSFVLAAPSDLHQSILLSVVICLAITDIYTYLIWPQPTSRVKRVRDSDGDGGGAESAAVTDPEGVRP